MYIPSFKLISQSMLKKSPENVDGRTDGRTDGQTDGRTLPRHNTSRFSNGRIKKITNRPMSWMRSKSIQGNNSFISVMMARQWGQDLEVSCTWVAYGLHKVWPHGMRKQSRILSKQTAHTILSMLKETCKRNKKGKPEGFDSCDRPSIGSKSAISNPHSFKIWQISLKNNKTPALGCFKLCASFHSHRWTQTRATVRKHSNGVKISDFFSCVTLKIDKWPWKQEGISSRPFQALWIILWPPVNSSWSYGSETPKSGQN